MPKPSGTNLPKAFHRRNNAGTINRCQTNSSWCQPKLNSVYAVSLTLQVIPRGRRPAARKKEIKAGTARGIHLFPSRTEKLSHAAPMVLRKRESRSPPHEGKPGQRAIAARASLFCAEAPCHGPVRMPYHGGSPPPAGNRIMAVTEPPWYDGSTCEVGVLRGDKYRRLRSLSLTPPADKQGFAPLGAILYLPLRLK